MIRPLPKVMHKLGQNNFLLTVPNYTQFVSKKYFVISEPRRVGLPKYPPSVCPFLSVCPFFFGTAGRNFLIFCIKLGCHLT